MKKSIIILLSAIIFIGCSSEQNIKNDYLYGTTFSITHKNGLVSFYSSVSHVNIYEGQEIKKGDVIAKTGTCVGEAHEGYHVHFEVMKNGVKVNPFDYLK